MRQYRAVVFDQDGTVLDSMPKVLEALNRMFEAWGLPSITLDHFRATFYMPFEHWYRDQGVAVAVYGGA